jgi:nucleotide-binding universal stress UspA family protein
MKILVAYDGSISADAAISDLRRAGLPEEAEGLVVCVEDGGHHIGETHGAIKPEHEHRSWKSRLDDAELLAEKAAERVNSCFPRWTVSSEALWGSPAKVILDVSAWWKPDLLVVGSHGHSRVARLFLGSVSLELVHKAACSVRVARARASTGNGTVRIVIGNDGSSEAETVVSCVAARSWPKKTEAQIISVAQTLTPVVSALDASTFAQEPAYALISEADERLRVRLGNVAAEAADRLRRVGLVATCNVSDADPREAILAAAEIGNADAIFVGARGVGRMERLLLGSVSSYVVTHAHCTVEVVRNCA